MFVEDSVYEITCFNVQDSDTTYRAIDEAWMIVLRTDTKVTNVDDVVNNIPRFKFGFVDDTVLSTRIHKRGQLTDVGGILRAISTTLDITKRDGTQTVKRELHVETLSGKTSVVSLWSDKKDLVQESTQQEYNTPLPIVVTSTTVSIYGRTFTFDSTKATKVYLGIKIPEIEEIVHRSPHTPSSNITLISKSADDPASVVLESVEATIHDLQDDVRHANCRRKKYFVSATITKLHTSPAWSYLSCVMCKGTVRMDDSTYICIKCAFMSKEPVNRYKLHIDILDATKSITITAFDKEAEGLIGHDVDEMLTISKMENGVSQVEQFFKQLVGVRALFEFRPSNYDINNPDKFLTARKITKLQGSSTDSNTGMLASTTAVPAVPTPTSAHAVIETDIKGKKVDDGLCGEKVKHQGQPTLPSRSKGGRRGIVIHDIENAEANNDCQNIKDTDKRRKKNS